jgi:hypothetical protein
MEVKYRANQLITNEAAALWSYEAWSTNVDVDDAITIELSNKVIELRLTIDSLTSAEQSITMLDAQQ